MDWTKTDWNGQPVPKEKLKCLQKFWRTVVQKHLKELQQSLAAKYKEMTKLRTVQFFFIKRLNDQ